MNDLDLCLEVVSYIRSQRQKLYYENAVL